MKAINVALLSFVGMALASITVYSSPWLGPKGTATTETSSKPAAPEGSPPEAPSASPNAPDVVDRSRFHADGALVLEGRVGHTKLAGGAPGETYLLLEARSAEGARPKGAAPSNLSLVIDRSGSMKGSRLKNAVRAAIAAVDSLGDGDVVSVISFDTSPSVVVPATVIEPGARGRVRSAIEAITLGGDTCISCGIEESMRQIQATTGKVSRMIVLSDGDANHGARDVAGFQRIAEGARSQGVSVTTIGVDLTYNQKILAVLAQASGGRHYFVEDDAALSRVFQSEAEALRTTVASDVEASIDLKEGVELARVFDRPFRREGDRVFVSLGSFSPNETKTILVQVRVPSPAAPGGAESVMPVADVQLKYRDLTSGKDADGSGSLAVTLVKDASGASPLDGVIQGRLARSETAAALVQANELFEQGKVEEAQRLLDEHRKSLEGQAAAAASAAPAARRGALEGDYKGQSAALSNASSSYGASASAKDQAAAKRVVRNTQMVANPYME